MFYAVQHLRHELTSRLRSPNQYVISKKSRASNLIVLVESEILTKEI